MKYTTTGFIGICLALAATASSAALVGTSTGTLNVSSSGAATYSMPLTIPPGLHSFSPNLSLEYNSNTEDSLIGPGWAVGGISQISRCPSTYAQNGVTEAVTLGSNDRFCLDGKMLKTSSTYGSVGAEYRTEVESFNYVTSVSGSQNNPMYFTTVDKAGTTRIYGETNCVTRTVNGVTYGYVWLLDSETDTVGNTIQYSYTISSSDYYPKKITYVQNNASGINSAHATISFTYTPRTTSKPTGYVDGLLLARSQLLTRIDSDLNSTAVRHWTLGYTTLSPSTGTQKSVLTSVTECTGPDETACIAPTTFQYQYGGQSYSLGDAVPSSPVTSVMLASSSWLGFTGDIDGDGRADLISIGESSSGNWEVFVAPGNDLQNGKLFTLGPGAALTGCACFGLFGVADLDGDGRTDIIAETVNTVNGALQSGTITAYLSAGNSFTASGSIALTSSDAEEITAVADFTGDGLADILLNTGNGTSGQKLQLIKTSKTSTGVSFSKGSVKCCFGPDVPITEGLPFGIQAIDLNGDGLPDIVSYGFDSNHTLYVETYLNPGTGNFSTTKTYFGSLGDTQQMAETVLFADVNGDGNVDIVVTQEGNGVGTIHTWLSKGDGTFDNGHKSTIPIATNCTVAPSANSYCQTVAGDFTGDGLEDILYGDGSVAASNGDGTFSPGAQQIGGIVGTGSSPSLDDPHSYVVADFAGNGIDEVGSYDDGFYGTSPEAYINVSSLNPAIRLKTITDGFGATTTVSYEPLTNSSTYTPTAYGQATFPSIPQVTPLYVVSSIDRTNPGQADRVSTYSYANGLSDLQGRGFLGFGTVTSQEPTPSGIVYAQTKYNLAFPYTGTVYEADSYAGEIATANQLSQSATTMDSSKSSMGSYFLYPHEVVTRDYEIAPGTPGVYKSSDTINTYDAVYGNLTASTETDYSGDIGATPSFEKKYADSYTTNCLSGGNQQMGLICQEQITRSGTNTPAITRTTQFGYDTNYLLNEVKLEPTESTLWQDSAFQRDGFGNIKLTTISGPDITTRSASDTYSAASPYYGRFDTSPCDALKQCHTLTFDGGTGNVLTDKDPNGIVTTFTYDELGRQSSYSIDQSGIDSSESTYYYWCSQYPSYCNSVSGALYVQYGTSSTGVQHVTAYDALSREVREAATLGDGTWTETLTDYDSIGRVSQVSSPRLSTSTQTYWATRSYDALDRITKLVAPKDQNHVTGSITKYGFNGLTSTVSDPDGNTTTTVRDPLDNITSVTDASTNSVTYQYDAFQNLTQVADNNNHTTTYKYNVRGYRTEMADPDMGDWIFTPDAIGDVVSIKDAKIQTTTFKYDSIGRLINRTAPDYTTTWTYDTLWKGALTETDKTNTVGSALVYKRSYTYWPSGGVKTDAQLINGATYTTSYTYDDNLRKSQITYPDTFAVAIQYSAYGAPNLVYQPGSTSTYYWQVEPGASWDEWGDVYLQKYGNGIETLTNRDAAVGYVDSIMAGPAAGSNNTVQSLTYGWDQAWNITSRTDALQANLQETYGYDSVNRLKSITPSANSLGVSSMSLKYDTHGNISTKSDIGTYGYGTSAHAVAAAGSTSYEYDDNGNMKSVGTSTRTYQWSSDNMPISLAAGSITATFGYGDFKDRVSEAISQGGSTSTVAFISDGLEEVWQTASGTTTYDYIEGPSGIVGVLIRDGANADTIEYLHPDALGSASVVTASNGGVSQRIEYDSFGQRHITAGSSSYLTTKGFTSHLQLDSLNLIHMNGRVYDPSIARFLSPDPVVQYPFTPQGWDRYAYVSGQPLNATDPSGFDEIQNPVVNGVGGGVALTSAASSSEAGSNSTGGAATQPDAIQKLAPVTVRGSRLGVQDLGGGLQTTNRIPFGHEFEMNHGSTQGAPVKSGGSGAPTEGGLASLSQGTGNGAGGAAPDAPPSGNGDTTSGGPGKVGNAEPAQIRPVDVTADRIESCIDCLPFPGPEDLVLAAKAVKATVSFAPIIVKGVRHFHHSIPKFLGGHEIQNAFAKLDSDIHQELHAFIRQNMKDAGIPRELLGGPTGSAANWRAYMYANPGAQRTALDAVLDASRAVDAKYGTSVTQDVWQNLMYGNYTPYP